MDFGVGLILLLIYLRSTLHLNVRLFEFVDAIILYLFSIFNKISKKKKCP